MKRVALFITLFILILSFFSNCTHKDETKVFRGNYFNQKPPGDTPVVFAPGLISTDDNVEFFGTFSPDGTEFYFTRRKPGEVNRILFTKQENEQWSEPSTASFTSDVWSSAPCITPDGNKLFFGSKLPLPGETELSPDANMWVTEKTESGWAEPRFFGSGMMKMSVSNYGNLFYTDITKDVGDSGYCFLEEKKITDNGYSDQIQVAIPMEKITSTVHPFIAPDENYIIFDSGADPNGSGGTDLFISFKNNDGSWSEPKNIGKPINSKAYEMCGSVSPDGNYLFFSRFFEGTSDIYWVSTNIIEKLKSIELN
jgi:hypothetical protein